METLKHENFYGNSPETEGNKIEKCDAIFESVVKRLEERLMHNKMEKN